MVVDPSEHPDDVLELRSTTLTLLSVMLKTADLARVGAVLAHRHAENPGLFDHDPVAIDIGLLRDDPAPIDFAGLIALLRQHRMNPIAAEGGSEPQRLAAIAAGLADAPPQRSRHPGPHRPRESEKAQRADRTQPRDAVQRPPQNPSQKGAPDTPPRAHATLVIDKPLRSGQQVYARGDLVVLGAVNFGAEVIADGHIHVYAPLRGRALAGARGNTEARIFSTHLEPQLVSIAGMYRTAEVPLPADVLGKPAQVRLAGESLVIEPLSP